MGTVYQGLPVASRQEELYAQRASDMWETLGCIEPEDRKRKGLKHKEYKKKSRYKIHLSKQNITLK